MGSKDVVAAVYDAFGQNFAFAKGLVFRPLAFDPESWPQPGFRPHAGRRGGKGLCSGQTGVCNAHPVTYQSSRLLCHKTIGCKFAPGYG